jgi:hypothetical protein
VLHGHISTTFDVYSFGIVILEIVSGKKNIDFQKSGEEIYLLEWVRICNLYDYLYGYFNFHYNDMHA